MMISSKGRYALRVLIDLAEHSNGTYIPMKEVAQRQDISLKYIEKIMPVLTSNGFVEGQHGKGGGYKLSRAPGDCRISDILRLTEGSLAPVKCLETNPDDCERCDECRTLPLWENFYGIINDYLDSVTLEDLMRKDTENSGRAS